MAQSQDPRAFRNLPRSLHVLVIAATLFSLVLAGGGAATAQTPTPQAYGPLTPLEEELYLQAELNTGAPTDPLADGGYPNGRLNDTAPAEAFAAAPEGLQNWATGRLCWGGEQCLTGDFNGDGKTDVAALVRDSQPDPMRGDVYVALSDGTRFGSRSKWSEFICTGAQVCKVGDVNADGMDDIVAFNRGRPGTPGAGNVFVALSQRTYFAEPQLWSSYFCINDETCEVANVDFYPGADIITFLRGPNGDGTNGDIYVASSNRINGFVTYGNAWHGDFCHDNEECHVADVTGDGLADAILFVKTGKGQGRVTISPSNGSSFVGNKDWASNFCINNEQCETGDFDGNGIQDVLSFYRNGRDPASIGDIWVNLSTGGGFTGSQKWNDYFCLAGQDCAVGDFNGDGRDDVIAFVKAVSDPNAGQAFVALASGTPTSFQPLRGAKWQESFCPTTGVGSEPGKTTCATGDFNGDGLDDIIYFVRNTQGGVAGQVQVALSSGTAFGTPAQWNTDPICPGYYDICRTGDVDGDGDDDIIVFSRLENGRVYVHRSNRNGFGTRELWNNYFCIGQEWCDVGDYNGDGLTDIALFTRSTYGNNDRAGDVEVGLSNGAGFINTGRLWHSFFCVGNEWCESGDVNGDGADDIIAFTRGSDAKVWVELSLRNQFGDAKAPAEKWQDFFCAGSEICGVGDFNGDGRDDIITFLRNDYPANPATYGDVYVGISTGSVVGGFPSQKWSEDFCYLQETCATGRFNVDNKEDVVRFTRGSTADVFVSLATIGTPFAFIESSPPPLVNKMLLNLFIRRR